MVMLRNRMLQVGVLRLSLCTRTTHYTLYSSSETRLQTKSKKRVLQHLVSRPPFIPSLNPFHWHMDVASVRAFQLTGFTLPRPVTLGYVPLAAGESVVMGTWRNPNTPQL